jgi:hypothetical protein
MTKPPVYSGQGPLAQLHGELLDIFANAIGEADCDVEAYLDSRDEPEFDKAWVLADEAVEEAKTQFADAVALEGQATELRKSVFIQCMRTFGDSDLAACVSDDAGLVFDATAMGVDNGWIAALLATYREGKLPTGPGYDR